MGFGLTSASANEKQESHSTTAESLPLSLPQETGNKKFLKEFSSISPSREFYLARNLPKAKENLRPTIPTLAYDALQTKPFPFSWTPNPRQIREYKKKIDELQQELKSENVPQAEEKLYWLADLKLAITAPHERGKILSATNAYWKALGHYPTSKYALAGSYGLSVSLLELRWFQEALKIAYRQEIQSLKEPPMTRLFESLILEIYFQRGRYVRGEDYFWKLATFLNTEELTPHLAQRFGDTLFWEGKFQEVVDWYEKMGHFLSTSDSILAPYSSLYYAEALFQIGNFEKSMEIFSGLQHSSLPQDALGHIEYRLLEIDVHENKNRSASASRLFQLANGDPHPLSKNALLLWARIIATEKISSSYPQALEKLTSTFDSEELPDAEKLEFLLLTAFFEEALGKTDEVLGRLDLIQRMREKSGPEEESLLKEAGFFTQELLLKKYEAFRNERKYLEFLDLADRYRLLIPYMPNKSELLVKAGDAYLETSMETSAVRLYQRLLFEKEIPDSEKKLLLLKLARAYALIGENDLLESTLKLVPDLPEDPEARKLYHLTHAAQAILHENYSKCVSDFEKLSELGITGEDLFRYSLQASRCAQMSGQMNRALQILSWLPLQTAQIGGNTETQSIIRSWQIKAMDERIYLLALDRRYDEVLNVYEELQKLDPEFPDRMRSRMILVDAYLQKHETETALALWKKYQDHPDPAIAPVAGTSYQQIIELLGQVEFLSPEDKSL